MVGTGHPLLITYLISTHGLIILVTEIHIAWKNEPLPRNKDKLAMIIYFLNPLVPADDTSHLWVGFGPGSHPILTLTNILLLIVSSLLDVAEMERTGARFPRG